jgi:hypothetical protein
MCKRKLEQLPLCIRQKPNPNALSSSQLLPTNKECASPPPGAELQRSADENTREHKHRVLHSARYSVRHSAGPQNAVNTTHFPKMVRKHKKKCFLR